MKDVKRLTSKAVCGVIKKLIPEGGEILELYKVIGTVNSYKAISTNHGESVALIGDFKATRTSDGEEFSSTKCFLSDEISNAMRNQLKIDGVESLDFGFTVSVFETDTIVGYEYDYTSMIPYHQKDSLSALEKRIEEYQLAQLEDKTAKNEALKETKPEEKTETKPEEKKETLTPKNKKEKKEPVK